jgi:signal transduction histidine kinase
MSLRLRLALLFALATAVLIAVAALAFVLQLRVSVEASLDPGLRARVMTVADELGSEGSPGLPTGGDAIVQISTPDGQLVASSSDARAVPLLDAAQRRQALTGEVSFTADVAGDRSRVLATAVSAGAGPVVVAVATGTDVADAAVERAAWALIVGGPPATLLAGAGAWLLAGAVLRPVERMRRQTAAISDDDLGHRLEVPTTRDEIAALGTTMNALLARLQDALARERGFVADAGHELRTPLAILRTELELAARPGRSQAALAAAIGQAGQETDRLIRLTEDLLLLARADNRQPFLRPGPVSVPELLDAAARGAGARSARRQVTVAVHSPSTLVLDADPDRLRQAVDNLIDNAARYAPTGTTVEVTATSSVSGMVSIAVADRGPGFPPDFLLHAFKRFRRADTDRNRDHGGTGLGLSIVSAIAHAHGGRALAGNQPSGGAVVTIELPSTGPPQTDPLPGAGGASAPGLYEHVAPPDSTG